ncbi:MFS transporter, partial [Candidatus Poribacteria bacterium]|nr:MFS transporter [Candidatus Poribacteria bacterium]
MGKNNTKSWFREIALVCFFLSGASGLMYEVAWNRMLGLTFGNTIFASSTVLTAFMSGLALGSYISGRYADRISKPLRIYAFLEIGIGIYCIFIPLSIKLLQGIYIPLQRSMQLSFYTFSLVRFVLVFMLLLIPATFMGATTPFFSRAYVRIGERFGHGIGRIYSINTFGAFAGVVASGFFMLENLGVRRTIYTAVVINVIVAVVCLLIDRRPMGKTKPDKVEENKESIPLSSGQRKVFIALLIGLGVSGFAAMVYELAWIRILAMILGSSVYAFSIMLATFLVGLALGSILFSFIVKWKAPNLLWFGIVELTIGVIVVVMLPLFGRMPFYFVDLFDRFGYNHIALEISRFFMAFSVMILPTVLLGSLFPMVTHICTRDYRELGRRVGSIYSVNTLGNIGGSFITGFVLIPYIGIQNSVLLGATLNILVACGIFLVYDTPKLTRRIAASAASLVILIALIFTIPTWDKMIISSGASVYAPKYADIKDKERELAMSGIGEELLYYKEGIETT